MLSVLDHCRRLTLLLGVLLGCSLPAAPTVTAPAPPLPPGRDLVSLPRCRPGAAPEPGPGEAAPRAPAEAGQSFRTDWDRLVYQSHGSSAWDICVYVGRSSGSDNAS